MISLFQFDILDNGISFILNKGISDDIAHNSYVDIELRMMPLVKSISELLMPYRGLSISRTIMTYEILDTNEQEVMLSKGLGIHIPLTIKNVIFKKAQQLAVILIDVMDRDAELNESKPQKEQPIWHPISMLPVISDLIKGSIEGAKDQYATLIPCKNKPYVLDDETVNRVIKLYISELEFVGIYNEQFARWEQEKLTLFQKSEIAKLKVLVVEWDKIITDILTLSNELSKGTIDKKMDMSNITTEHVNIALEIDRKYKELDEAGLDNASLLVEMYDLMPKFKRLMDELSNDEFNHLSDQFSGFYDYAKYIEWIATQIASGEIKVPR